VVIAVDGHDPIFVGQPGDLVWAALEEPASEESIVEEMSTLFAGTRAAIDADVAALLTTLVEAGAVSRT
jgi:hypothetical protein